MEGRALINSPVGCFRRSQPAGVACYPTQHPGRVLVPRLRRGQKAVTVQGGYGAVFAIRVQILFSITRVAVQV